MVDKPVKRVMCDMVKVIKEECGYTYQDIIETCRPLKVSKEQIRLILNSNGEGVGYEHINNIINEMGYTIHYNIYNYRIHQYLTETIEDSIRREHTTEHTEGM